MRWIGLILLMFGCTGSDGKFVAVNASPEALITSHSTGDEVTAGETVLFAGNGSDTDHGSSEINATWVVNDDTVCDGEAVDDSGATICSVVIPYTSGITVRLEVRDPGNEIGVDSVTLTMVTAADDSGDPPPDDSGIGDTAEDSAAPPIDTGDTAVEDTAPPPVVDDDGDGSVAADDCDDTDAAIHPDAVEICDDIDNDCDGLIDDADDGLDAASRTTWYGDSDGDGWGVESYSVDACVAPEDYVAGRGDSFDCDDTDPAFHPDAPESDCADPADYNCDGSTGYRDADGDGWAACEECHDLDASINPDATEVCDSMDNDCDGLRDDEDDSLDPDSRLSFYTDGDGDGFGDEESVVYACEVPDGAVAGDDGFDCADDDAAVHPDADEICDDIDNDCDGDTDDDDSSRVDGTAWAIDYDGDGHGSTEYTVIACEVPDGFVSSTDDCDDLDSAVHPDAAEICDGEDNNCDGDVDGADATDPSTWYVDDDGDGFGDSSASTAEACDAPSGWTAIGGDCDDLDAMINPSALEVCDVGDTDEDCDGGADDDDPEGALGTVRYYVDADIDGYGSVDDTGTDYCDPTPGTVMDHTDCDDSDPGLGSSAGDADCDGFATLDDCDDDDAAMYPGAPDTWYDGLDSNCDAASDYDADTDGYDHDAFGGTDCDDGDDSVHPGSTDVWYDGVDADCDTASDYDADTDGFDSAAYGGTDCDDGVASTYPGAADSWYDGVDSDCGGDNDYDADTDGYDSAAYGGTDCDDGVASTYPGATETWYDGVDSDCSGGSDYDADGDGYESDDFGGDDCDDTRALAYPGADEIIENGLDEDCDGSDLVLDLGSLYSSLTSGGRTVYVFQSSPSSGLPLYNTFCEDRGMNWYAPTSSADADNVINTLFGYDGYHTWIISKSNTTAGTWNGHSVSVDNPECLDYSSSGFSAIRNWGCSFCDPEIYGTTSCWDGHSYDWLVCEV
jgi:hypothetical protein